MILSVHHQPLKMNNIISETQSARQLFSTLNFILEKWYMALPQYLKSGTAMAPRSVHPLSQWSPHLALLFPLSLCHPVTPLLCMQYRSTNPNSKPKDDSYTAYKVTDLPPQVSYTLKCLAAVVMEGIVGQQPLFVTNKFFSVYWLVSLSWLRK